MGKIKTAFFNAQESRVEYVFGPERRARVAALSELFPAVVGPHNFEQHCPELQDLEVIFSTWGMPTLGSEQLERLPALKAVFYAAGSVKGFAEPLLRRGIRVSSAWRANGEVVAWFAMAQIILGCKGFYLNQRLCRTPEGRREASSQAPDGIFEGRVALVGFGAIGRRVAELLRPAGVEIMVVDPQLDAAAAAAAGVVKTTMEEAFRGALVVSNHLPNLPSLQRVIGRDLLAALRPGATFINTGRGAQVDETALVEILRLRPDLTAVLDVTFPEPPPPGSEFYSLPNVYLTSHIAGAMNRDTRRMADTAIAEFLSWQAGKALAHEVTLEMLPNMA